MITLIIGKNNSGKSAFAEDYILRHSGGRRIIYLATMIECDDESRERIVRHRKLRENKGFVLLEKPMDIGAAEIPEETDVLLEDVGNLVANEVFEPEGGGEQRVLRGIKSLSEKCHNLVMVSNDFSSFAEEADEETGRYIDTVRKVNEVLKQMADEVYIIPQDGKERF